MNLLSSTTVFSFYTMMSRVLGYFRDILIAIFLGSSIYADAFFVAFRLQILLGDYLLKEHSMLHSFQVIPQKKLEVKLMLKDLQTKF